MTTKAKTTKGTKTKTKRKRGKSDRVIRNFSFWAEPASREDGEKLLGQIGRHVDYRFELAREENEAREQIRQLDSAVIQRRRAQREELLTTIFALKNKLAEIDHEHVADMAPLAKEVHDLSTKVDSIDEELKELYAKQKHNQTRRKKIQKIWSQTNATAKKLRALVVKPRVKEVNGLVIDQPGVGWGTYLIAEDAHFRSKTSTPFFKNVRPSSSRREGSIGVQLQSGASKKPLHVRDLTDPNALWVRVHPEKYSLTGKTKDPLTGKTNGYRTASPEPTLASDGKTMRTERLQRVDVRIGSDPNRRPVWCSFHVLFHREMPANAVIKWVKVHRRRTGVKYRHEIQFTLDVTNVPVVIPAPKADACGIAISTRRVGGGFQIARAYGSDGLESTLVVPDKILSQYDKAIELRKLRDDKRDNIRRILHVWRKLDATDRRTFKVVMDKDKETKEEIVRIFSLWGMPDDANAQAFKEEIKHVLKWNRVGRFVALYERWKTRRFPGDEQFFDVVGEWLIKDRHLYQWEGHALRRMRLHIHKRYEMWAAEISKHYGAIGVVDQKYAKKVTKAQRQDPSTSEEERQISKIVARMVTRLAPASLVEKLQFAADKRHRYFTKIKPESAAKMCTACGRRHKVMGEWATITCPWCSVVEDRQLRIAKNILARTIRMAAASAATPPPQEEALEQPNPKKSKVQSKTKRKVVASA